MQQNMNDDRRYGMDQLKTITTCSSGLVQDAFARGQTQVQKKWLRGVMIETIRYAAIHRRFICSPFTAPQPARQNALLVPGGPSQQFRLICRSSDLLIRHQQAANVHQLQTGACWAGTKGQGLTQSWIL